jgi:HTH-type transcriptional regulator/antitoxin HipB
VSALPRPHGSSGKVTQAAVAGALGRHQPFIANIENGDRRLDVVEFLLLAETIGFDPCEVMREIASIKSE